MNGDELADVLRGEGEQIWQGLGKVGNRLGALPGELANVLGQSPMAFNPEPVERDERKLWAKIGDFPEARRAKVEKAVVAVNKAADRNMQDAAAEYKRQSAVLIGPEQQALDMLLDRAGISHWKLKELNEKERPVDWRKPPGAVPSEGMEETGLRPDLGEKGFREKIEEVEKASPEEQARWYEEKMPGGARRTPTWPPAWMHTTSEEVQGRTENEMMRRQVEQAEENLRAEKAGVEPQPEVWWRPGKPKAVTAVKQKPIEGLDQLEHETEFVQQGRERAEIQYQIETYARELLAKNPDMGYEDFEKRMREKFGDQMDLILVPGEAPKTEKK